MSTKEAVVFAICGLVSALAGLKLATGHGLLNAWYAWALAAVACWTVMASMATTRTMPVESRRAVFRYLGSGLFLMAMALTLIATR